MTFHEIYEAVKPMSREDDWNAVEQNRVVKTFEKLHLSADGVIRCMDLEPDGWTVAEKAAIEAALHPISTPGDADAPETPAAG